MNVGSSLEVVTTLMGWWLYDLGWTLMSQTGLVYIPLIAVFYRNVRGPSTSQETRPATTTSLKRMIWDVVEIVFVLLFFATPLLALRPELVVYEPTERSIEGEVFDTGQQVDIRQFSHADRFFAGEEVKISIGPGLLLNLINGLNFAIKERLVGSEDIRSAQNLINAAFIEDPAVRDELVRFTSECYAQSLDKYYRLVSSGSLAAVEPDALEWIANPLFMQTPGLYRACFGTSDCRHGTGFRAHQQVMGFAERPYCDAWWRESDVGLRDRLYDVANGERGWLDKARIIMNAVGWDEEGLSPRDQTVKAFVEQARYNQGMTPQDLAFSNSSLNNEFGRAVTGGVKSVFGFLGTALEAAKVSVVTFVAALAAPMIKAVLMLFLIALMPYFFVISFYDIGKCFLYMIILCTVQFWGALWAIAAWVDQTLIYWLYPSTTDFLSNVTDAGGFGTKRMLLDMITTTMYIGLPLLFTLVLTWAGHRGLVQLNNATTYAGASEASRAGSRASGMAERTAGKATEAVSRVVVGS